MKNSNTTSEIVAISKAESQKTANYLGKAIASFVRSADKLATQKETLTALIENYLKQGGDSKLIRKETIAAGVDRRRVSEVLISFGVKSEHSEARSKAGKAAKVKAIKAGKAPSSAKLEKAGAVVNFVMSQGKGLAERVEILQLAIAELKKASKKASK